MNLINNIINRLLFKFIDYLPQLIGGFLIVLVGFVIAKIITNFIKLFFRFFRIFDLIKKTNLIAEKESHLFIEVFLDVLRLIIFLAFLIPAFEVWGLTKAASLLNQLISFLPNVIISLIIAFFGIIFSNLGAKLITTSPTKIKTKKFLSLLTKMMILFFTGLIILNQLGVAQDLIRILFAGIVGLLALAGGLAFGLGGKDLAKELLESLKKNLS